MPSARAARSAPAPIQRPITSSASTCANAQIVPRTSALIPLRMSRRACFGKIGSIVLGLNASSPRVRLKVYSEPSLGWVGDSDGELGRVRSGLGGRTVVVWTNFSEDLK